MSERPPGQDLKAQAKQARADLERRRHQAQAQAQAQFGQARAQFDQVGATITARTGRNLLMAVPIGIAIGVLAMLSIIFWSWLFLILAVILIGLGVVELGTALRQSGRDIPRTASAIATVAVLPVIFFLGAEWRWVAILSGMAFVILWRVVEYAWPSRRGGGAGLLKDVTASILVQAYVVVLGSFTVLLASPQLAEGRWWLLAMIIVVVATDTGAYAAGRAFGRHKMAPTISPGKTWEGLAGALAAACIAGILLSVLMMHVPWWFGLVFGAVLTATGTLGDLAESLIKRDIGVKDMSSWLPGHGGILDRLDSLLPSAAAAYALYVVFFPLFT